MRPHFLIYFSGPTPCPHCPGGGGWSRLRCPGSRPSISHSVSPSADPLLSTPPLVSICVLLSSRHCSACFVNVHVLSSETPHHINTLIIPLLCWGTERLKGYLTCDGTQHHLSHAWEILVLGPSTSTTAWHGLLLSPQLGASALVPSSRHCCDWALELLPPVFHRNTYQWLTSSWWCLVATSFSAAFELCRHFLLAAFSGCLLPSH